MASAQAFETGLQQGIQRGSEARLHKQALSDEEHQQKINDQLALRSASMEKLRNLKPGSTEYNQSFGDLQKSIQGIRELYHPDNHPQAISKFGHLLTDALHITKPQPTQNMVIPNPHGLVEPGNLNIWERPSVQNADGSHSSEYSTSFQDDKGREVLVPTVVNGKFLTPDGKKPPEGSDAEKAMFQEAWKHYLKTGENLGKFASIADANAYAQALHSRGPAPKGIVKQEAKQQAAAQGDKNVASSFASVLPPSDMDAARSQAQAQFAGLKENVTQAQNLWDENNKDADEDTRKKAHQEIFENAILGYKQQRPLVPKPLPGSKPYKGADGKYYQSMENPDGTISAEAMPPDYVPPPPTGKPKTAWGRDKQGRIFSVQLDENNQTKPGTENYSVLPPPGMLPTIRSGVYHWVDADGGVHEVPETTTSRRDFSGAASSAGSSRTGTSNPEQAPPKTKLQSSAMMKQKIAHNFQNQDKILGYKGTPALTKAQNNLTDADGISALADQIAQKAETNPDDMSEADTQFVLKLIKSDAGRVNQQEIAMLFDAGGLAEGPDRWLAKAGHGQLSTDLRNQLIDFAHSMRDVAQAEVARLKQHPGDPNNPAPAQTTGGDWRSRAVPIH